MVTILAGGRGDSWAGPPWKEGSQDRPPSGCNLGLMCGSRARVAVQKAGVPSDAGQ